MNPTPQQFREYVQAHPGATHVEIGTHFRPDLQTDKQRKDWTSNFLRVHPDARANAPEPAVIPQGITPEGPSGPARIVPRHLVIPSPLNPRKTFDHAGLEELAESIREVGIIQPIVVRPVPPETFILDPSTEGSGRRGWQILDRRHLVKDIPGGLRYTGPAPRFVETADIEEARAQLPQWEIIGGERRWRASELAGLAEIPIVIRSDVDDATAFRVMLDENERRRDLNPIERAEAWLRLQELRGLSQRGLAQDLELNQATISRAVALLKLPEPVKDLVRSGQLSGSHAERLVRWAELPPLCEAVAAAVVELKLPVRDLEKQQSIPYELGEALKKSKAVGVLRMNEPFISECQKCPFNAYLRDDRYNYFCAKPAHLKELRAAARVEQAEQKQREADNLAALRTQAEADGKQLVDTRKLSSWSDYREHDWSAEGSCCSRDCACAQYGLNYRGQLIRICTDPKKLQERKEAGRQAEKERRTQAFESLLDYLMAHQAQAQEIGTRELAFLLSRYGWPTELWQEASERTGTTFPPNWSDLVQVPPAELVRHFVMLRALELRRDRVHEREPSGLSLEWYLGVETPPADPERESSEEACTRCGAELPLEEIDRLLDTAKGTEPFVGERGAVLLTAPGAFYCAGCSVNLRICRECGCTQEVACPEGCSWVQDDLCSACAGQLQLPGTESEEAQCVDCGAAAAAAELVGAE